MRRISRIACISMLAVFPAAQAWSQTNAPIMNSSDIATPNTVCGGTYAQCNPDSGIGSGNSGAGLVGLGAILSLPFTIIQHGIDAANAAANAEAAAAAKKADDLNNQGIDAFNKGDWPTAADLFSRSLDSWRDSPVVQRNLANAQNWEGVVAYNAGNYTAALNFFKQASAIDPAGDPDGSVIQKDLIAAQGQIAYARQLDEQHQKDKVAAASMQKTISKVASSLSATPTSGGLSFSDGKSNSDRSSLLTVMASNDTRPGAFGTTNANPKLALSPGEQQATVHSTVDQLSSAANSGADAKKANGDDLAKDKSGCAFDTDACANYSSVSMADARAIGQTPGAAELTSHIPDAARSDKEIQQSVAYYQKLDSQRIDTQAKLANVEQQIKDGKGDAKVLEARKQTLANDLERADQDEASTQTQIKKRLVAIKIGWTESPPPQTGKAAGGPTASAAASPGTGAPANQ